MSPILGRLRLEVLKDRNREKKLKKHFQDGNLGFQELAKRDAKTFLWKFSEIQAKGRDTSLKMI